MDKPEPSGGHESDSPDPKSPRSIVRYVPVRTNTVARIVAESLETAETIAASVTCPSPRIVICDYAPETLDRLAELLHECLVEPTIVTFASGDDALVEVLDRRPDLLMTGLGVTQVNARSWPSEADEAAGAVCRHMSVEYEGTDHPRAAVDLWEQAADRYATAGFLNCAVALCQKTLRTAPDRTHVYLKLARLMLELRYMAWAASNFAEFATRYLREHKVDDVFVALQMLLEQSEWSEELLTALYAEFQTAEMDGDQRVALWELLERAKGERDRDAGSPPYQQRTEKHGEHTLDSGAPPASLTNVGNRHSVRSHGGWNEPKTPGWLAKMARRRVSFPTLIFSEIDLGHDELTRLGELITVSYLRKPCARDNLRDRLCSMLPGFVQNSPAVARPRASQSKGASMEAESTDVTRSTYRSPRIVLCGEGRTRLARVLHEWFEDATIEEFAKASEASQAVLARQPDLFMVFESHDQMRWLERLRDAHGQPVTCPIVIWGFGSSEEVADSINRFAGDLNVSYLGIVGPYELHCRISSALHGFRIRSFEAWRQMRESQRNSGGGAESWWRNFFAH